MFARDCAKLNGRHIDICLQGLVFGSCCALGPADDQPIFSGFLQLPRVPTLAGNYINEYPDNQGTDSPQVPVSRPSAAASQPAASLSAPAGANPVLPSGNYRSL